MTYILELVTGNGLDGVHGTGGARQGARSGDGSLSPLTRQAVHGLGAPRSPGRATGPVDMYPIGPAPGGPERGVEHPFARVDLVAHPQDQ